MLKDLKYNREMLLRILRIGLPAGIQGMVFPIANVCIQSGINSFGSDAMAGSTNAMTYEYMSYLGHRFAQTAVTFTANFGAGKVDRCKRSFRLCLTCGVCLAAWSPQCFLLRAPLL